MKEIYNTLPNRESKSRIENLVSSLKKHDLDGVLLFSQVELFYYSGIGLDGCIYVSKNGDLIHYVKRSLDLAKEFSQIDNVRLLTKQSEVFTHIVKESSSENKIGIEGDILPFSFFNYLTKIKPVSVTLIDSATILRKIRSIKSGYEIKQLEKSASIVDASFEYVSDIFSPEMKEIELTGILDSWMLKNGHSGYVKTRGFNSSLVHYSYVLGSESNVFNTYFTPVSGHGLSLRIPFGPSNKKIGNNPFIIDSCGNYNGYISDETRTFIPGKLTNEIEDILNTLIHVKQYIKNKLRKNINLGELYNEIHSNIKETAFSDYFMGYKEDKVRFLGHGIGLELDELPIFYSKGPDTIVGNILAIEPKFAVPKKGIFGLEDDFLITENGNKILTKSPDYIII